MLERIKQHWLISIIVVCSFVAAAIWKVAIEVRIEPLKFEISRLQEEISRLQKRKEEVRIPAHSTQTVQNGMFVDISGEIHSPIGNQSVSYDGTTVVAETDELPRGMERWLLLYASGERRWYPVRIANNRDRKFSQKIIRIGRPDDDFNSNYDILLFIIDNDTGVVLRKYEAEGKGIDFLPYGKEIGKVTVRR